MHYCISLFFHYFQVTMQANTSPQTCILLPCVKTFLFQKGWVETLQNIFLFTSNLKPLTHQGYIKSVRRPPYWGKGEILVQQKKVLLKAII